MVRKQAVKTLPRGAVQLTGVEALSDGGGINQVASTQAACDVLVDVSHLHCVLDKYR